MSPSMLQEMFQETFLEMSQEILQLILQEMLHLKNMPNDNLIDETIYYNNSQ